MRRYYVEVIPNGRIARTKANSGEEAITNLTNLINAFIVAHGKDEPEIEHPKLYNESDFRVVRYEEI